MDYAVNHDPITSILLDCRLFDNIGWKTRQLLIQSARLSSFERGHSLFLQDQTELGLFLVKSGRVKLSLLSSRGSERVIEVVEPGGTFGETRLCGDPTDRHPCLHAEMLDSGELLEISRHSLSEAMTQAPEFSLAMMRHMSAKLCWLVSELETCCLRSARERVIDYLLALVDEQQAAGLKRAEVCLPANKGIVASLLDLTPETFSREMQRLSRQGLIEMDRRTIRIPAVGELRLLVC